MPVPTDEWMHRLDVVKRCGSWNGAARELGLDSRALKRGLRDAIERGDLGQASLPNFEKIKDTTVKQKPPDIELPAFPDEDIPVEQIIDLQTERFKKRMASHEAHTWFPVKVRESRPIGLLFVGDPHIDDNGCHWPSLRLHTKVARETEGIYGVNIGDTTNCWGGRLIHKYKDQDTSARTARRLAEWFLLKSGINWLLWLYGNHEHMGDGMSVLAEMAKRFGTKKVVMHDWEARFVLQFPNGQEFRINAAHDFPGNSIYNPLHGPLRAMIWGNDVDLMVCGHKHNWGVSQWEMAEKGTTPLMVRVRGYKFLDDFARKIGKYDQMEGQSILVVFDPNASTKSGRMMAFADVERGASYLTHLRNEAERGVGSSKRTV